MSQRYPQHKDAMPAPLRVLIVDDSPDDTLLLVDALQAGGYAPQYARVDTAAAMREALAAAPWDLVLADYALPHFSGPAALQVLHENCLDLPFIVVSGKIGEEQAVEMMKAGAHDYIAKGNLTRLAPAVSRELQEAEVRREHRRAEEALHTVNRSLRLLSAVNQALMRATTEAELFHETCRIAVEVGGYRMVWIGVAEHDPEKTVRPVCSAGYDAGYLETMRISWADNALGRGPTGTAIRTGQPTFARNVASAPEYAPWRAEALKRGYHSSIALPLIMNSHIIGALNLYGDQPDAFVLEEVKLLMEMAGDLAYGIRALRAREQRTRAEEALRIPPR